MSISLRINKVRMVLAGLVLAAAALLPHRTEAQTNPTAQSLPYYQDFSSFTGTTTTYPAGWQGWTSTTALSTSYTTAAFTADATLSTGGASNGITSAFVADMRGKMGLLSTASNQRAICLAFSTTGLSTVTVSYVAATQSQVYGGRIDQLGLQYRVGITGAFTNLTTAATDYRNNVASAITSTGDSNATNAAFISLTLPAACNNQSVVQVRWIIKDSSGAGNRPSFSIDNISVFASSQITNYYNKAGFRLDSLGSWGTNTDGTGTVPSAFTNAGQQFNIQNSNTGISGSTWTVTGNCSKIIVNNTDFSIPSSKTVTGIINVRAGRTLTLNNTTFPTLDSLAPTSTVVFASYSTLNIPYVPNGYGGITIDGSTVGNPANQKNLDFSGNLTLQNSAALSAANINICPKGSADQTINGNGLTLSFRNLDNNITNNKTGKLLLRQNTPITVNNSLIMNNFGASNSFSDSANTISVVNNITDSGNAAGYVYTGTLNITASSGTVNIRGGSAGIVCPAALNNININTTGTAGVSINPTAGGQTFTIKGNLTLGGSSSGSLATNGNTIKIGGNFSHTQSTNRITFTNSTFVFNGTSTQLYSTSVSAGHSFNNLTINNSNGLNLFSPLSVGGSLELTSGKIRTGSNVLSLAATATVTGGSTSSYVSGTGGLSKIVPSGGATAMTFEVGDTTYSPVRIGFNSSTTTGTIRVRSTYGTHPSILSSSLNTSFMTNRYWTVNLTSVGATAFPMTDTFSYSTGDITGGSNSGFVIGRYDNTAATWSYPTTANYTALGSPLLANGTLAGAQATTSATIDYVAGKQYAVPTITNINPRIGNTGSGSTGTQITITGSNFNTTDTGNIVFFGATKGSIDSVTAGGTLLYVKTPLGATHGLLHVFNKSGGFMAGYKYPFLPKFDNSAFITDSINFLTKVDYSVGSTPNIAAIGDLDGDGKPEFIAVNKGFNSITVYKNTTTSGWLTGSSFTLVDTFITASGPENVKLADFDGDGRLDVVVTAKTASVVSILRNTSSGGSISLASRADISTNSSTGRAPIVLVTADFDGDGKIDIATANQMDGTLSIMKNNCAISSAITSSSFATGVTFTAGTIPISITVGDFDGDGLPDPAVLNYGTSDITVFRNTSTVGSFSFTSSNTSTGTNPTDIIAGDIDGDGFTDLVAVNFGANSFTVLRNTNTTPTAGTISFSSAATVSTGASSNPIGVGLGDVNGDGKVDIVVSNGADTSLAVYRNKSTSGSVSIASGIKYRTGIAPAGVNIGDLDGDKFPEIVVGNTGSNTISILKNYPLPYVTPITGSDSVCVGATITLSDSVTGGTWISANSSIATVGASSGIVTGVSGSPSSVTITYRVISGGDTNSVTKIVTVKPLANPGTISGSTTLCVSSDTTLTTTDTTGGTWSSSNTSLATVNATTGRVRGVSAGSVTITYTVTNSCGSQISTFTMTINPLPNPGTISGTLSACVSSGTTLTSSGTSGGTWSSSASSIATVDPSSGDVTGVAAGTATISYSVTNSCGTLYATAVYTVNATPDAGSITGTTTVCPSASSSLSNSTFSGGTGSWSSSNTSIATIHPTTGLLTGVAVGSATITFTVSGTCGTAFTTVTANVNASPSAGTISGTLTACVGASSGLTDGVLGGTWSSSNASIATVHPTSGDVTGVAVGSATITYTVTNSCGTAFTTASFTVNDVPAAPAAIGGTLNACVGATSGLTDDTTGGTWSSSNTSIATVHPTSGSVLGVSAGTATISYTVTNSCGSTSATATFTVNDVPSVASIGGTPSACVGATSGLTNTTGGGTWSSSNTSIATVNPTSGSVLGVAVGSATISYTVTNSCGSSSATITFNVSSAPSAGTISGTLTACVGTSSGLTNGVLGGTWSSSNSSIATVHPTGGSVTGVSAGSATITYTVTNSCGTAFTTASFTVNDVPAAPAAIGGTLNACVGATSGLTDDTTGGTWSSSATSIATVHPTSGSVLGVSAGTATISYTVTNSCGSTSATATFTVNDVPSVAAIGGTPSACVSATSTLTNATSGGTWSSSNTSIATVHPTSGNVLGVASGSATISYTVTNSCGSSSATITFNVSTAPSVAAIGGTTNACVSATSTLTDATSGGTWSSSASSIATVHPTSGLVTGVAAGTATISYTVTNSCGSTSVTTTFTVNSVPGTPAAIGGTLTACTSATSTLTNDTTGGTWSSSATSIATIHPTTGVVTGVAAGTANISYSRTNSCGTVSATAVFTVTTVPTPSAITGATTVSVGGTTAFTDSTAGGTWTSSATSVATVGSSSGTVTGVAPGTATITYTVTNSCGSGFVTKSITVTGFGQGNLVVTGPYQGNVSNASKAVILYQFTTTGVPVNTTILPCTGSTTRITMSGNATSEGFPSLAREKDRLVFTGYNSDTATASIAGTASASVGRVVGTITQNGTWTRLFSQSVISANNPRGATASDTFMYICGANTGIIYMNPASPVTISTTSTNNRVLQNINGNTYFSTGAGTNGVYYIAGAPTSTGNTATLIAASTNSYGFAISPNDLTIYSANASGIFKYTRATGGTTTATLASGYTTSGQVYAGGFSGLAVDFSTTNPTIYATTSDGLRLIKLTDAGSTVTTALMTLTIDSTNANNPFRGVSFAPAVSCSISGTATLCAGSSGTVTVTGNPYGKVTYTLNGAAPTTITLSATGRGTITSPSTAGTYTYALSSIQVPSGTTTVSGNAVITINSAPTVPAITGTTTVCAGATTTLADTATGGTWTSSNTSVATVTSSGVVTGVAAGTTTISYAVTNSCGTTTVTTTVTVNGLPTVGAISGTSPICVSASATYTDTTAGGTWSSSAPSIATVDPTSGSVTGLATGSATITYSVTNSCGTTNVTYNVTILDIPTVAAISGTPTVCVGSTTNLTDTTSGGTWSSNDTTRATVNSSGVVTGIATGNAIITYTVTNACGSGNDTILVTVNSTPIIGAITGTTNACVGGSSTLGDTTGGGTWSSSASSVATVDPSSGAVTGVAAGTATISYGVTTSCGTTYATTLFTVNTVPSVGAISGTSSVCVSGTTALTDTTSGGTWSSSASSIATVHPTSGLVTGVAAGSATISYAVTNACGTTTVTYGVSVLAPPATPSAITGASSTVCVSATLALSDTTAGGTWSSSNTSRATVTSGGIVTGVDTGAVTISYTVSNSCGSASATYALTVLPVISSLPAISGPTSVCAASTITLTDSTSGGTWSSSSTSIATVNPTTGVVMGVSTGTTSISYALTTSCGSASVGVSITVLDTPVTPAAITGATSLMTGMLSTYSDTSAGGTWSSSNVSVATINSTTGLAQAMSGGSCTISYTRSNSCGTRYRTLNVNITTSLGAGNLMVLQVNDTLNTGSAIALVEYATTGGSPISTNFLPFSGGSPRLVMSGTATSEGAMSLDSERTHIIVPGYDTTTGLASSISAAATNVRRAIFSVNPDFSYSAGANLPQSTTFAGNNFRGATAAGGRYYGSGTGSPTSSAGPRYMVGTTTNVQLSSSVTNIRTIQIFNGQLYFGTGSGTVGVYAVGTGIPTTSVTNSLINSTGTLSSPYGFSISPDSNTLYVADDGVGIYRFTRSGTTYGSPVQINATKSRGLVVDYTTTPYTIYATTSTGTRLCTGCNAYSDSIIKVVDNGAGSSLTFIAAAPTFKNFRGLQFTPTPKATIKATTASICSGTRDTLYIWGNPGDTVNYTVNSTPTFVKLNATGRALISQVYTNTTSATATYAYSLTSIVTSLGTFVATGTATITVSPAVTAPLAGTSTICSGSTATISVTGGTPSALVTLSPGGASFTLNASGNGSTTVSPTSTTVYYRTATLSGCSASTSDSATITVNPLPTASITGTASIYSGGSTPLTFSGTPNAVVLYNNGSTTDSITLNASGSFTLTVSPTVTTTYTLVGARATTGCYQTITGSSATVTVSTLPFANISVSATTLCFGSSDTVTISGTGGARVIYSTDGGTTLDSVLLSGVSSGTGSATLIISPTATVTYTLITIRSGSYSGSLSGSATITVIPTVSAGALSGTTSICMGSTSTLSSTVSGGVWASRVTTVDTVNATSGTVYPVSPGTSYVRYTVSNSCFTASDSLLTTVNALPTATISSSATITLGSSTNIIFSGTASSTVTYTTAGGSPTTITLNSSGSATLTVTPTVTTIYAITSVLSTAGCTRTITGQSDTITVLQPFADGNLIVVRPEGSTNIATQFSLVQYDTSGNFVSTVTLPGSGASQITMSGTATSEGNPVLSAERDRIITVGYDVAAGTTGGVAGSTNNRVIGSTNIYGIFTRNYSRNVFSANNIRAGVSYDTSFFGLGANTGIMLMNNGTTNVCSTSTNNRVAQIYNGQFYFSTATGTAGIWKMGTNIPNTAGNTAVVICRTGTSSPYGFSISPDGNTMFVADDGAGRGIRKYVKTSGVDTFPATPTYTVTATPCMGVAVDYTTTPYIIYATTRGNGSGTSAVDSVIKMRDGSSATITRLVTSPTGNPFRGLSFAPYIKAKVTVTGARSICSGASTTVKFTGNPYATVKYHVNSGSIQTTTLDYSGTSIISSGALTTSSATVTNYIYSLDTIITPTFRKSVSGSDTVTVNPKPVITAVNASVTSLCVGGTVNFSCDTLTEAGARLTYSWSGPASYTSAARTPAYTPSSTSATGIYSAVATNTITGCVSDTATSATVNVNTLPTAGGITASPSSLCVGNTIHLTATGTPSGTGSFVSYNWSGPGGFTHTGTGTSDSVLSASLSNTGYYSLTVTYSAPGCTSNAVVSDSITVNASPTLYNVTGGGSYCGTSSLAVGLSGSQTGFMYELYLGSTTTGVTLSGTGSSLSIGSFTVTGTYHIVANGAGGCTATMNDSATIVNASTGITLGASPSVCQPISSTNISYYSTYGAPATYSTVWDATAITAGFTNDTAATLSSSSVVFPIPSGSAGHFTGTLTVSNGVCTSTPYSYSITVYAHPDAALTSVSTPCVDRSSSIVITGTPDADVTFTLDSGSTSTATLSGGSYTFTTGALDSGLHDFHLINVHNPVCTNTGVDTTANINPIVMQWVGGATGAPNDWNTDANWTCGYVPTVTDNVIIPNGYTYNPVIATSTVDSVASLTIASSALVEIDTLGSLHVQGAILNNNGSVIGSGYMVMDNGGSTTIHGDGAMRKLLVDNSTFATINTGSRLTINKELKLNAGTQLTTNDSLVFNSSALISSRLAPSNGTIYGKAKVVQYVPPGRRAYRFWAHPFSNTIPMSQIQACIDLTGPRGDTSGFTMTGSNAPSIFRYNPLRANSTASYDPGWLPFTSALPTADDSNKLNQYQGVRMFIRGAKGEGLGYTPYTPSAVTIQTSGYLNQGTQIVHLQKGTLPNQSFNMVGNPYISTIDIGTVAHNELVAGNIQGGAIYIWNPYIATFGNFQSIPINTTSATPFAIQANASFQVEAAHDGDSITFNESDKTDLLPTNILRTSAEFVDIKVYDANHHLFDGMLLSFNNDAHATNDRNLDARKPMGPDFNLFSITNDSSYLALDARPFDTASVIPLGIRSNYKQDYIISTESIHIPEGGSLFLHDKWLEKYVAMEAGSEYKFSVTKDAKSQGNGRFEICMKPANTTIADVTALQVVMLPNPATDEVNVTYKAPAAEEVNIRIMDITGKDVFTRNVGVSQNGTVKLPVNQLAAGIYMVEFTSGNNKVIQRLIKE